MKSVAILGCGPAGLMAAHAAALSEWDFHIYSRRVKSNLYGAQYLHAHIPGLTRSPTGEVVRYQLTGTPEQYRRKVYGDEWDGTVSPKDFMDSHMAWDLRRAYDTLWDAYEDEITNIDIGHYGVGNKLWYNQPLLDSYDLVISTVPRKIWAQPGDKFLSTKVWALGDTELPRVEKPYRPAPFTVMCNGQPHVPWYRVSNIFGYCTMEWPYIEKPYSQRDYVEYYDGRRQYANTLPPAHGASLVEKPLSHNSTAAADFVHLGRYGAWEKGVLTSDVFFQAMKVFADDKIS